MNYLCNRNKLKTFKYIFRVLKIEERLEELEGSWPFWHQNSHSPLLLVCVSERPYSRVSNNRGCWNEQRLEINKRKLEGRGDGEYGRGTYIGFRENKCFLLQMKFFFSSKK